MGHKSLLSLLFGHMWLPETAGVGKLLAVRGSVNLQEIYFFYHFPTFLCKSHWAAFTNYRIRMMSGAWLMAWGSVWLCSLWQPHHRAPASASSITGDSGPGRP